MSAQNLQNCTPAAARRIPTPQRMSPPSGDASAAAGPSSRTAAMSGLIRATTWTPRKPAAHATGSDPAITASDPPSPAAVNGASAAKPTSSKTNPTRSAMPAEYSQTPARHTRSSARQAPAAMRTHVWRGRREVGRARIGRSGAADGLRTSLARCFLGRRRTDSEPSIGSLPRCPESGCSRAAALEASGAMAPEPRGCVIVSGMRSSTTSGRSRVRSNVSGRLLAVPTESQGGAAA
jgi:hypothetical protein